MKNLKTKQKILGCIFTEKFENFDFESCNNIFTPEIESIYRGMTTEELESGDFSVSWTLSKECAEFFAFKYGRNFSTENKPKVVHQLEVKKVEILAYFNERNEQEVIYIP